MLKNRWLVLTAIAAVALMGAGAAFAGGAGCHDDKASATAAKNEHQCNMTAEECAQEMQKAMATRGWLGITMDMDEGDTVITKVYPGSPADQAGFQSGDRLVSLNGVSFTDGNDEKIHSAWKNAKIGDTVTYVVSRNSEDVTLKATLAKMPEAAMAEAVQMHMKEDHHAVAKK